MYPNLTKSKVKYMGFEMTQNYQSSFMFNIKNNPNKIYLTIAIKQQYQHYIFHKTLYI